MIDSADLREQITTDETTLRLLADGVVNLWERLTGRVWKRPTNPYVFVRTPSPTDVFIWVPLYPIETLTLVEWWRDTPELSADAVPTADYSFRTGVESGKITKLRDDRWRDYVKATVQGGYTTATAPPIVKLAMIAQAVYTYTKNKANRSGVTTESHGKSGGATYRTDVLHEDFKQLAMSYHRV